MKNIENILNDKNGLMYSTELLLSIILLIFIIGIMANITDEMNDRILSTEELSSLEDISIRGCDYLLNNPGKPENWEDDDGLNQGIISRNIIPGLAIKNKKIENGMFYDESKDEMRVLPNTISYKKLMKMKNNYDDLINLNLFNDSLKSSISVYPLGDGVGSDGVGNMGNNGLENKIIPIHMGDDLNDLENDVLVVNRTVKCDFYSNFVIYNFNDFELYGDDYEKKEECNHDSNPNLENHSNDMNYFWLCKSFRVYRNSLNSYNYYLISHEDTKESNVYYVLESLNRTNDNKQRINQDIIDLNPFFTEDLENSSNEIYSIHFKIPKNNIDNFKTVLIAIPKNMSNELIANNQLNYDYFRVQNVNFVLKTAYK